jgi:hypothetical protein
MGSFSRTSQSVYKNWKADNKVASTFSHTAGHVMCHTWTWRERAKSSRRRNLNHKQLNGCYCNEAENCSFKSDVCPGGGRNGKWDEKANPTEKTRSSIYLYFFVHTNCEGIKKRGCSVILNRSSSLWGRLVIQQKSPIPSCLSNIIRRSVNRLKTNYCTTTRLETYTLCCFTHCACANANLFQIQVYCS